MIGRFVGLVAKYPGDGVSAYFGSPVAHEDDAERAVRAGLELVAVGAIDAPGSGSGGCEKNHARRLGEPEAKPNIAAPSAAADRRVVLRATPPSTTDWPLARLQALAAPGSLVISQATRRRVGGLFELEDLGPKRLGGVAEPLAAWRVAGEGRTEG